AIVTKFPPFIGKRVQPTHAFRPPTRHRQRPRSANGCALASLGNSSRRDRILGRYPLVVGVYQRRRTTMGGPQSPNHALGGDGPGPYTEPVDFPHDPPVGDTAFAPRPGNEPLPGPYPGPTPPPGYPKRRSTRRVIIGVLAAVALVAAMTAAIV